MQALSHWLRIAPIAIVALALSACANNPPPDAPLPEAESELLQAALNAEDLGIVCKDTYVLGSRIPRMVCTTAEQRLLEEELGEKFLKRIQRGGF